MKNKKHNWKNTKCSWKSRKQSCGGMKYIKCNAKNKKHIWRSIKCDWDCVLNDLTSIMGGIICSISFSALADIGAKAFLCGLGTAVSVLIFFRKKIIKNKTEKGQIK